MKKYILLSFLVIVFLSGCQDLSTASSQLSESTKQELIQQGLVKNIPVPVVKSSSTRKALVERTKLFDAENKTTYIYLISYGKVMAFYPINGQAVSLRSYLTPMENITNSYGTLCKKAGQWNTYEPSCSSGDGYMVSAPDVDGTYGDNPDGIFFFAADSGAYIEWKGDYMVSDQPLQLSTPPALVRNI